MPAPTSNPRIALLVNYLYGSYQGRFREAFERAATERHVDLFVAVGRELEHEVGHERALNRLYDWVSADSVHGVAVLSAAISNFTGKAGVQRLCQALAPLPSCSIGLPLPGVPSIVIDNRAAMKTAVRHLIAEHGCQHVAYIGGPDYNDEARERHQGYRDALDDAGIAFDERRVAYGRFSRETGAAALRELLGRDVKVDAVAAANDDMAMGALDALFERGLRVPEDVKVVGFDDAPIARLARRPLTTVAQSVEEMAAIALDGLLETLRGGTPPASTSAPAALVTRESCGCGYLLPYGSAKSRPPELPVAGYLRAVGTEVEASLAERPGVHAWESLLPALTRALASELEGEQGAFLRSVEHAAEGEAARDASADDVGRALLELWRRCQAGGYDGHSHHALERAYLEARAKAFAIANRDQGLRALRLMDSAEVLRGVSQDLAMVLSAPALAKSFARALSELRVPTGYLAVRADDQANQLRPLLALDAGETVEVDPAAYPARQLFAAGFPRVSGGVSLTLHPLTVEDRVVGLVSFASRTDPFVCEALRSQLSAALELSSLHARVVAETAMRERLAHEQLLGEVATARRIQSALCPSDLDVPGFEVAARLVAADQVGGDYYDVLPAADGCWVGVGDVTGHGLLAGLIMLMIQSSVSTAILASTEQRPSEVLCRVNGVLESNIRRRLHANEHATLLILRAHTDGRVLMAGAHEDVIVHRRASGACELLRTDGLWVGINDDIREATHDQTFQLEPGDTIVLYTDGLIEARDARDRELHIDHVCELVKGAAAQGPRAIVDALIATAHAWTPVQRDDITVVALRRSE